MFVVQFARNIPQLCFVEGEINGLHLLAIDPGPHDMCVSSPFLFMKDDGPRLVIETEFLFDGFDRRLKYIDRDFLVWRRIKA
jgi:hypothetical protein